MKTLKTKKYNIDRVYLGLINIAPGKYETIKEMEVASKILDTLLEEAKDYYDILEEVDRINEKYYGVKPESSNWKNYTDEIEELNKKIQLKEKQDRSKTVTLDFEDEEFNQFFQFTERWAKNWFSRVKEFLEFRNDMSEANSKPKKK